MKDFLQTMEADIFADEHIQSTTHREDLRNKKYTRKRQGKLAKAKHRAIKQPEWRVQRFRSILNIEYTNGYRRNSTYKRRIQIIKRSESNEY